MLDVQEMGAAYGQSRVLHDMTLSVAEGEVATLMGRNGMGKTTTVWSVLGLVRKTRGRVMFDGQDVTDQDLGLSAELGATALSLSNTVGSAAGLAIAAPIAILDPKARDTVDAQARRLGQGLGDSIEGVATGLTLGLAGTPPARRCDRGVPQQMSACRLSAAACRRARRGAGGAFHGVCGAWCELWFE
mgnify:CR=1 FL=1